MDLKDAYHHIPVHINIRKYFRFVIAGKPYQFCVLPFGLSTAPHEFTKTLATVVQLLRSMGPCLSGQLDHPCRFSPSESSIYPGNHDPIAIFWLDNKLKKVYVDPLTHHRLPGSSFQSPESCIFPSRIFPRFSHTTPFLSVNVHDHACQKTFIHHQSHFALRSLHPSWMPAPQVSPVLDQVTVDPTQAVLGHSITTGCRISFSPALVQQTGCSQGSSVTSTGTQPVLFHRCFPHRLWSQLAIRQPESTATTVRQ